MSAVHCIAQLSRDSNSYGVVSTVYVSSALCSCHVAVTVTE